VQLASPAAAPKITLPPDIVRNFRVTDAAGTALNVETAPDGSARVTPVDARDLALVPNTHPTTSVTLGQERVMLPVVYLHFKNASGQVTETPVEGGVFLQAARSPMVWDKTSGDYATDVFVGYDYGDDRNITMPASRSVLLLTQGTGTTVAPDRVTITQSGAGGAQRVAVRTKAREGAVTIIARETPDNEQPVSIPVEAEAGGIAVTVSPSHVEAFGLGTGAISVRLLALDGREMPAAAVKNAWPLSIDAPLLGVATQARIEAGQTRVDVPFRTRGSGDGFARVEAGGFSSEAKFVSALPWLSIAAVTIGSLLGGVARWFRHRQTNKRIVRRLLEALVVGVVFVAAAWAGLVGFDLGGVLTAPLGGFVLAALAAYTGMVIIDRVAGKVMQPLEPAKKEG
jgi:hypothetical protein